MRELIKHRLAAPTFQAALLTPQYCSLIYHTSRIVIRHAYTSV